MDLEVGSFKILWNRIPARDPSNVIHTINVVLVNLTALKKQVKVKKDGPKPP